jgi:zinc transport system substrate-binding protein
VRPHHRSLTVLLLLCGLLPLRAAFAAPSVIVSIAPLHSLAAAVMEGAGSPQLLLRGSSSPHSFSLRPSDARALQQAQLLFWVGPTMELPLARIIDQLPAVRSVPLLDSVGLERLPRRATHQHGHGDHDHDMPSAPANGDALDPHVWLSPPNAIVMARRIADELIRQDPDNAALYRANLQRLSTQLAELDRELEQRLATVEGRFAVFHDAFQYLEARYGLASAGMVSSHPERSPGAAHLSALTAELRHKQVRCLFSEPQFPGPLVEMLVRETGIRHAVLDPLGSAIPPGPGAYEATLRAIADALIRCMHGADDSG